MRPEQIIGILEKKHILSYLRKNQRLDERTKYEMRPLKLEAGIIKKAEGSCQVELGDTKVIAGVKSEIGTPFPDTPDMGVIIVNIEFSPMASPIFESGPPGKEAIELARVVDRGIRESKMVDLEKLCIIPGKAVHILFIDIYVLDHFGNLFDACSQAAVGALLNTKVSVYEVDPETNEPRKTENLISLPINNLVTSLTFSKIDDIIILDNNLEEERVKTGRFTVAITANSNVCAIQKGESDTFSKEEVFEMLDIAAETVPSILKQIETQIEGEANGKN
ncbi:MAG: exosome complex protein Rrp42 [Candidatus Hodarchaeota archaeon]